MFDLTFKDIKEKKRISNIYLKLLGKHNVLNAWQLLQCFKSWSKPEYN